MTLRHVIMLYERKDGQWVACVEGRRRFVAETRMLAMTLAEKWLRAEAA